MKTRNYGAGTRDLGRAGCMHLRRAIDRRALSFGSAILSTRWIRFSRFARLGGCNRMEHISTALVEGYGRHLATEVEAAELSCGYAANLLSAVNTVMDKATMGLWVSVSSQACGIPPRQYVRMTSPASYRRDIYLEALAAVGDFDLARVQAGMRLAREFGLRSKEFSLINARRALKEAKRDDRVTVKRGAKGGRKRVVPLSIDPVWHAIQMQALEIAAQLQGVDKALIPRGTNWKSWRDGPLRSARELLQPFGLSGHHDLRAGFACEYYLLATGWTAPCCGGRVKDRKKDLRVRRELAEILGHRRPQITNCYLGSCS